MSIIIITIARRSFLLLVIIWSIHKNYIWCNWNRTY